MPEAAEETGPFRVRDEISGAEYTSQYVFEGQTKINEPAVDESGRWLEPKNAPDNWKPKSSAKSTEDKK